MSSLTAPGIAPGGRGLLAAADRARDVPCGSRGLRSDREGVMTTSERMGAISGADRARRIVAMPYSRRAIGRSCCALLLAGAFVGATLALARPVAAVTMVDCNTPNDFCTGDPCMTTDELQITVASCVLDFGTRALVLNQVVFVPNGGSLTLSAGSIEVDFLVPQTAS